MKEKFNEIIHSKKIIVILIIVLIILVGVASTYAWFTWSSTNNTSLTMSIGELADVSFTTGNDISTNSLSPVFNYTDGEKTTFTIRNKTDTEISYKILLNITSIADELKSSSLKYKLLNNNTVVAEGDFSNITSNSSTSIYNGTLSNGSVSFTFYLYIDGNIENDLSMMGKSLSGSIMVSAEEKTEDGPALDTLNYLNGLNSTIALASGTPDFTTVSGNNGVKYVGGNQNATGVGDGTKGIYATQDDLGTSYYFRGAVDNNYVYFANFYWRIIRINGDGTIRMIYAGSSPYENGYDDSSSRDMDIGDSKFNTSTDDNTYVGYMTGTPNATTYDETHSNTTDSTIKAFVDEWYSGVIFNQGFENYVADAIYCNDRSVVEIEDFSLTGNGIGSLTDTGYGATKRNEIERKPSLICHQKNDKFTTNEETDLGNGKLTYPIGLITADEAAMAGVMAWRIDGIGELISNSNTYLYNGNKFWTMSPSNFNANVDLMIFDIAHIESYNIDNPELAVRPVISLKYDAITSGNGTLDNPFSV